MTGDRAPALPPGLSGGRAARALERDGPNALPGSEPRSLFRIAAGVVREPMFLMLLAADVGIAMGERGTDVAREAAAIVLLDDSFASITAAIRQGRQIDDNLRDAMRFVFAVHVPVIALALIPVLLHWPVLLLPAQIVVLQLIIDPACSVLFEAEPALANVMERPPRPAADSPFALPNLAHGVMQGLVLAHRGGRRPAAMAGNPWLPRLLLAVAVVLALVLGLPWLRAIMGFELPSPLALAAAAAMLAATALWNALLGRLVKGTHTALAHPTTRGPAS